jgi:hypothetical protein
MLVKTKFKKPIFLACIMIRICMQAQVYVHRICDSIFHITVGSGLIKMFTYVIQSSSDKMLGLLLWNIFHLQILHWRSFLFDYLLFIQRGLIIVSLRMTAVTGTSITFEACSCQELESVSLLQFQHALFHSRVLNCWLPASKQALHLLTIISQYKIKILSWNINNISLKLALLLLQLKWVSLHFLYFS